MSASTDFSKKYLSKIFEEKQSIIDIGGGLRISREKGNRFSPGNEWLEPLAKQVDYKILDPIPDYSPDIVGDIHDLPFKESTVDAVICLSVLEHVENPLKAMSEIRRVLKPGGYALIYVPFLYYYHAERDYYKDYWRFSEDALRLMGKDFSTIELQSAREPKGR